MSGISFMLQLQKDLHVFRKGTKVFDVGYEEADEMENPNNTSSSRNASHDINSSHYICPICLMVARDPIEVNCCNHWYCANCFLTFIGKLDELGGFHGYERIKCAVCRKVTSIQLETSNVIQMKKLIPYMKIRVQCPFQCGKTDMIANMKYHEELYCSYRPIHCPFKKCMSVESGNTIMEHMEKCEHKCMYCPNCKAAIQLNQFHAHNCVDYLRNAVILLENELRCHTTFVKTQIKFGMAGDIAFNQDEESDGVSGMERYCKKYNKPRPMRVSEGTIRDMERVGPSRGTGSSTKYKQKMVEKYFGTKRPRLAFNVSLSGGDESNANSPGLHGTNAQQPQNRPQNSDAEVITVERNPVTSIPNQETLLSSNSTTTTTVISPTSRNE